VGFKEDKMEHSDTRPAPLAGEYLRVELQRPDWATGLSEDTVTAIMHAAERQKRQEHLSVEETAAEAAEKSPSRRRRL